LDTHYTSVLLQNFINSFAQRVQNRTLTLPPYPLSPQLAVEPVFSKLNRTMQFLSNNQVSLSGILNMGDFMIGYNGALMNGMFSINRQCNTYVMEVPTTKPLLAAYTQSHLPTLTPTLNVSGSDKATFSTVLTHSIETQQPCKELLNDFKTSDITQEEEPDAEDDLGYLLQESQDPEGYVLKSPTLSALDAPWNHLFTSSPSESLDQVITVNTTLTTSVKIHSPHSSPNLPIRIASPQAKILNSPVDLGTLIMPNINSYNTRVRKRHIEDEEGPTNSLSQDSETHTIQPVTPLKRERCMAIMQKFFKEI
jgi:hypothetical protein